MQEECLSESTDNPKSNTKEKKINIIKKNIEGIEGSIEKNEQKRLNLITTGSEEEITTIKNEIAALSDCKTFLERDLAAYENEAPHVNLARSKDIEEFVNSEDFEDYINLEKREFVKAEDFTDLVIEKDDLLDYMNFDAFAKNLNTAGLYKNGKWYCRRLNIHANLCPSLRAFEYLTGQNVGLTFVKESKESKEKRTLQMIRTGMDLSENPENPKIETTIARPNGTSETEMTIARPNGTSETETTIARPNGTSETGNRIIKGPDSGWDESSM